MQILALLGFAGFLSEVCTNFGRADNHDSFSLTSVTTHRNLTSAARVPLPALLAEIGDVPSSYNLVLSRINRGNMASVKASIQSAVETQSYEHWVSVTLRFGDTDKLGHINNAVYASLFESGRCHFCLGLFDTANASGRLFTLARVAIDFVEEMHFPGDARVGTRILSVGKSSITLGQGIFKDGRCTSVADSVMVLIDNQTRRSTPLTAELLDAIASLRRPN